MERPEPQSPRPVPESREAYPHFREISTLWMDNEQYSPNTTNHRH
jgi:hypothetical protein